MLSVYIHDNRTDIIVFEDNVYKYICSSLKEYVNNINEYEILDKSFLEGILKLHNKKI